MANLVGKRIILARQRMTIIDDDKAGVPLAQGRGGPTCPSDDGQVMNIFGTDAGYFGWRPYSDAEVVG